jgi:hypothetical protein
MHKEMVSRLQSPPIHQDNAPIGATTADDLVDSYSLQDVSSQIQLLKTTNGQPKNDPDRKDIELKIGSPACHAGGQREQICQEGSYYLALDPVQPDLLKHKVVARQKVNSSLLTGLQYSSGGSRFACAGATE